MWTYHVGIWANYFKPMGGEGRGEKNNNLKSQKIFILILGKVEERQIRKCLVNQCFQITNSLLNNFDLDRHLCKCRTWQILIVSSDEIIKFYCQKISGIQVFIDHLIFMTIEQCNFNDRVFIYLIQNLPWFA